MSTLPFKLLCAILAVGSTMFSAVSGTAQNPAEQPQPANFRIAGTVVSSVGGGALPRTRVTIRSAKDPKDVQFVVTGDDGRFEFHVKAGKYGLQGAKRGFITADYDAHEQFSTAIVTGAALDTENILLKLAPSAVLRGRILDESGDPVRGANVALWREDHSTGVSRIVRSRNDIADDRGEYEFTLLDGGTYFLSVSATPWYAVHPASTVQEGRGLITTVVEHGLDVVYPTTYYAGATESEDATPIPIRGGDRLELDLHPAPVLALHVVFRSPQNDQNMYPMPFLQKRVFDGMDRQMRQEAIQTISPGIFEVATAPGKYAVRLSSPAQNSRITEIEISQDHQEVDTSSGEALSKVAVSVHVQDEDKLPSELFLTLRDPQRKNAISRRVNSHGEAEFEAPAPAAYELVAGSSDNSYSVTKIVSEGQETSGHTLKVSAGSTMSVSLTLAVGYERIEGFAQHAGKAVAGAMVVLIPKHPEANRELFRRDQSDLDGSFSLQRVIPGTYTVVAIADGWELDWSQPAVISKYLSHGQTVVVPRQGSRLIRLLDPVEVQPK